MNGRREDWGQDGEGLREREVGEVRVGNEVGEHAGHVVLVPKVRLGEDMYAEQRLSRRKECWKRKGRGMERG